MGIKGTAEAQALMGLSSILGAARQALGVMNAGGNMLTRIDSVRHDLQAAANDLTAGVPGASDRARAAMEAADRLRAEMEREAERDAG